MMTTTFKKWVNEYRKKRRRDGWVTIRQSTITKDKYRRYDKRGLESRNRRYIAKWNKIKINDIRRKNAKQQRIKALQQRLQQIYGI